MFMIWQELFKCFHPDMIFASIKLIPANAISILDETELRFTKHFFTYIRFAYTGKVDPKKVQWHIPKRKDLSSS